MVAGAWFGGVEEAEALRGTQADSAGLKARMPAARGVCSQLRRDCDVCAMAHAALPMSGLARPTSWRISRLLKPKVISAEARFTKADAAGRLIAFQQAFLPGLRRTVDQCKRGRPLSEFKPLR